ncbi:MAG: helix-turn-helix domain-containing protein [Candidatus Krumholzibacteriia bacterium]
MKGPSMDPQLWSREMAGVVRYHRKRAGLTRIELARLAGIGKTAVFDIEHGKTTVRMATLLRVLSVLNVTLEWRSPLAEAFARERSEEPSVERSDA